METFYGYLFFGIKLIIGIYGFIFLWIFLVVVSTYIERLRAKHSIKTTKDCFVPKILEYKSSCTVPKVVNLVAAIKSSPIEESLLVAPTINLSIPIRKIRVEKGNST